MSRRRQAGEQRQLPARHKKTSRIRKHKDSRERMKLVLKGAEMAPDREGAEKRAQWITSNLGLDRPALTLHFIKKEPFKPTLKIRACICTSYRDVEMAPNRWRESTYVLLTTLLANWVYQEERNRGCYWAVIVAKLSRRPPDGKQRHWTDWRSLFHHARWAANDSLQI